MYNPLPSKKEIKPSTGTKLSKYPSKCSNKSLAFSNLISMTPLDKLVFPSDTSPESSIAKYFNSSL
jgi:hypothetical protein